MTVSTVADGREAHRARHRAAQDPRGGGDRLQGPQDDGEQGIDHVVAAGRHLDAEHAAPIPGPQHVPGQREPAVQHRHRAAHGRCLAEGSPTVTEHDIGQRQRLDLRGEHGGSGHDIRGGAHHVDTGPVIGDGKNVGAVDLLVQEFVGRPPQALGHVFEEPCNAVLAQQIPRPGRGQVGGNRHSDADVGRLHEPEPGRQDRSGRQCRSIDLQQAESAGCERGAQRCRRRERDHPAARNLLVTRPDCLHAPHSRPDPRTVRPGRRPQRP